MQSKPRIDESLVFPDRPKNDPLRNRARCPGPCGMVVKFSDNEDADQAIATNCAFYCPKPDSPNRWINDERCYAKASVPEVKVNKPWKKKKGKSYYKNKKKRASK